MNKIPDPDRTEEESLEEMLDIGVDIPYIVTGITYDEFIEKYGQAVASQYAFTSTIARYKPPGSEAISG